MSYGVCALGKPIEKRGFKCKILKTPIDIGEGHHSRMKYLAVPALPNCPVPFFHHSCVHNEKLCIMNRVLGKVPLPTEDGLITMRMGALILRRALPRTHAEKLGLFAEVYSGHKRLRYLEAVEKSLMGYSKFNAGITAFVKKEKMFPDVAKGFEIQDPRPVQFRDAIFCVQLARFLKPIEHHLYNLKIKSPMISETRLVGKGLNQIQRGELLAEKLSHFKDPVVISLDCKRFDKHVSYEQLQVEHSVYLHSNPDPEFARILSWQLVNKCRTRSGFRYKTYGKRMSGDMNTALGNCVIMMSMVIGVFTRFLSHIKYDLFDDGDDCLVIVEREFLDLVSETLIIQFHNMGHVLKVENVAYKIEHVQWCQSHPVLMQNGKYKFVRNPIKTMANDLVSPKLLSGNGKVHVRAVGLCELALNLGVPVLQNYALALIRNSEGAKLRLDDDMSLYLRARREISNFDSRVETLEPKEISFETRKSFEEAFGIPVMKQIDIEQELDKWSINYNGTEVCPVTYDFNLKLQRMLHEHY